MRGRLRNTAGREDLFFSQVRSALSLCRTERDEIRGKTRWEHEISNLALTYAWRRSASKVRSRFYRPSKRGASGFCCYGGGGGGAYVLFPLLASFPGAPILLLLLMIYICTYMYLSVDVRGKMWMFDVANHFPSPATLLDIPPSSTTTFSNSSSVVRALQSVFSSPTQPLLLPSFPSS